MTISIYDLNTGYFGRPHLELEGEIERKSDISNSHNLPVVSKNFEQNILEQSQS